MTTGHQRRILPSMQSHKEMIRRAIKAMGSRRALAKKLQVNERTVRRWEAGELPVRGLNYDHVETMHAITVLRETA